MNVVPHEIPDMGNESILLLAYATSASHNN
jgi:hypothetical protein